MSYDVASVRGLYTGLSDGWTYLNAHDTPQIAERVTAGVARAFRTSAAVVSQDVSAGSHSARPAAGTLEGPAHIEAARRAVADLVGVSADRVILGPSLPVLYSCLAAAMGPLLRRKSSVVLSQLDDPALTRAFAAAPAEVRWAQPDLGTGELPAFQYEDLVSGNTRLVVLSAAHDLLGTVAPVEEIIDLVRTRSRAWTVVDVSSLAAYRPVKFDEVGAHILGLDLVQLGGPQMAALVLRDSSMLNRLDGEVASPVSSGLAGGVGPLVDHLAQLGEPAGARGSRRVRLGRSLENLRGYLDGLRDDLYTLMSTLPAVHIFGVTGEAAADATEDRLPRLTFAVNGVPAETVHQRLFDNGLVTTLAPSTPLLEEMGMDEVGGAVTVSLSPFNTRQDIEQLVRVVASLA